MLRLAVVFFVSSVLVFGLCRGDSEAKKLLEKEIKKAEDEIAYLKKDISKLKEKLANEKQSLLMNIKVKIDSRESGTAKNIEQHKLLEKLFQQLAKVRNDIKELKEAPENVEKLKLGIEVMKENIKVLDERRSNKMTDRCFKLEHMKKDDTEISTPSVLTGVKVEDTIVLENSLRLLQTEVARLEAEQSNLNNAIQSQRDYFTRMEEGLNNIIKRNGDDHQKGQESIELVKKELEEQRKALADLEKTGVVSKGELEKWKKEAKKILTKYKLYALDIECYKKLNDDVITLAMPNP